MNPPPLPCSRRQIIGRGLFYITLGMLTLFTLCVLGVANMFFPQREVAILRDELRESAGFSSMHTRVQFSVGSVSTFLMRSAFACVESSKIEPEARLAVSALRGASVGVYQLDPLDKGQSRQIDLKAIDARMGKRGWARMVTVLKGDETVLVYVSDEKDPNDLKVCVAVCKRNELVLVSARAALEPLIEIVQRKMPSLNQAALVAGI